MGETAAPRATTQRPGPVLLLVGLATTLGALLVELLEQPLFGEIGADETHLVTTAVVVVVALVTTYLVLRRRQAQFDWIVRQREELDSLSTSLRTSERKYRQLFEQANDAILIFDPESEVVFEANERALAVYGFERDEFIGMSLKALTVDIERGEKQLRDLVQSGTYAGFETTQRRKDGSLIHLLVNSSIVDFNGRPAVLSLNRDVTALRQAEAAMQVAQAQWAQFLEVSPDPIWIKDASGRYVAVNDAWVRFWGLDRDKVLGRNDQELTPGQAAYFAETDERAKRDGWMDGEFTETLDGRTWLSYVRKVRLTDASGQYAGVLGLAQDITARKAAEDALRLSEARLREAQRIGHIGSFQGDLVTGRVWWSEETYRLFGLEPADESLTFGRVRSFIHPEDLAHWDSASRRSLAAGASVVTEYRIIRPDGTVRHHSVVSITRAAPDGTLLEISGTVQDITERKRAEESMRLAQAQWSRFLEVSPDPMWIKDASGRYVAVNDASLPIWERPREEIIGKTDADLSPDWADLYRASDDLALRNGAMEGEFSHRIAGRDRIFLVSKVRLDGPDGSPAGTLALARDITARKAAEEALQESEQRFRSVAGSAVDAIVSTDDGGRIVGWNRAAERTFGYTEEEVLGQSIERLMPAGFRPTHGTSMRRLLRGEEPRVLGRTVELAGIRRDGHEFPIELSLSSWEVKGRTFFTGIIRDITDRRRMEEQLVHAQKMEAIGTLAGGVAHDFNNLLQAMVGLAELIGAHNTQPERISACVAELQRHIKRGSGLTRQLLVFSRRETTRLEAVNLNELVEDSTRLLGRLVRANVLLRIDLAAGVLLVKADRGQIEQVLMNLTLNAADAMPLGGTLAIRTGSADEHTAYFEVADTGHGIPEGVRARIFEPFFTTKDKSKGTGLGLAVVHGIVTQHGGTIEVESEEGKGATFRILLPLAAEQPATPPGTESVQAQVESGSGERILLVEDEPGARQGLAELLVMLGYRVTAVGSAEEAGRLPHTPPFDLLLTDFMLPGLSGVELASGLADRWPHLRVILMSGYTQDEAVRRGVTAGDHRYLQKPFDLDTLAREVQAALGEARARD